MKLPSLRESPSLVVSVVGFKSFSRDAVVDSLSPSYPNLSTNHLTFPSSQVLSTLLILLKISCLPFHPGGRILGLIYSHFPQRALFSCFPPHRQSFSPS